MMAAAQTDDPIDPDLLINREWSWLAFNERVLAEGLSPTLPLLERLKFLAIVSSNLDEFFLIRVAGLMQLRSAGSRRTDPTGLTAAQQLAGISERVHRMVPRQAEGVAEALAALRPHGLRVLGRHEWSVAQQDFADSTFAQEVLPVLTPLAVEKLQPMPLLPSLQLNVALIVGDGENAGRIVVLPVPAQLPRFVTLPAEDGVHVTPLETVIAACAGQLFPTERIDATAVFRITRDADVPVDDAADDLLQEVEQAVVDRRRRHAVRLELSAGARPMLRNWLVDLLDLNDPDVYEIDGMLDAAALMELVSRRGYDDLRDPEWPAQPARDLIGQDDIFQVLRSRDVLLHHPYESFDPVVQLVQGAAADPNVLAIKQTLYRTSGDSPIVNALATAAENGKDVSVLVELKARFDEARNVTWARRLENAGCHVIYGIAGYKTHAKAVLIVRREAGVIRRYVHLSTGNYNDKTARLYSDIGLMTSQADLCLDVANFFNLVTGGTDAAELARLTMAPTGLRAKFIELIEREIDSSTPQQPGLIMAKVNSLQDPDICTALARASQAGVTVRLNVRGICCLRPGVPGASERVQVRSIIDRFLEHARIFYFHNGGHDEVYLSSADWMGRNLDRRLELLFPVTDEPLRRRIRGWLDTYAADNLKSWQLMPDGTYERVRTPGKAVRAQLEIYQQAVAAASDVRHAEAGFRPLSRPED